MSVFHFEREEVPDWPDWDGARDWQWHGTMTSTVAAGNGFLSHGLYSGLAHAAEVVLITVLRSQAGGIVLASLLFGLAHAPGSLSSTRGTQEAVGAHPSWLMAVGYSIVVTSVAGVFLGVLWARTRNLLLVMAVHAAGDWLPNLLQTIRNWF